MIHPAFHGRRRGITLIEILVVIAIIAILAALLTVGISFFWVRGAEAKNRNDILQLSTALQKFHSDKGFYPPSRIRLCSNRASYGNSTLDQMSLQVITTMWPNIQLHTLASPKNINWDGTGTNMQAQDYILEGDQCLVFFLGGIPVAGIPSGFSLDPTNPTTAGGERKKWMTIEKNRLVNTSGASGTRFPSYLDAFAPHVGDPLLKKPFMYFSSNKRENGYHNLWSATKPYVPNDEVVFTNGYAYRCLVANTAVQPPLDATRWAKLMVSPYCTDATPTVKYHNPSTFQIISAGKDGIFGTGGLWPANLPSGVADDMSNFHERKLGNP